MQTHLTVKGLILRESPYGETAVIFDLLTDNGILTVSARGIRKAGSKYAAATQPFTYGAFCLRKSGERYYLDSAVSIEQFSGLRTNLEALALAAYYSELVRKTATTEQQPQVLRLFLVSLHYLADEKQARPLAQLKAIFELRLLCENGFTPQLLCCSECCEYLPEKPVMRIDKGDFCCAHCIELDNSLLLPVTQAALQAIRHTALSEFEKLFAFRISGRSLALFARYAERYALYCIDAPMPSLKYYHTLCGDAQDQDEIS